MIDNLKGKVTDFFYDLFNPPVLPYVYKMNSDFSSSFLNYFLLESENLYVNKNEFYSLLYKISFDNFSEFVSFLDESEFLMNFDLTGFSFIENTQSFDYSVLFWVVKEMSIDPYEIDLNLKKMLNVRKALEAEMKKYGFVFGRVLPDYLLKEVQQVSWYKLLSRYNPDVPISLHFKSSSLILRDELFYSPSDIFVTYSLKTVYMNTFGEVFQHYPFMMRGLGFEDEGFPYTATYTTLIDYESKFSRRVVSFLLLKFVEGIKRFKDSSFYRYDNENNCVDFSFFEEFVSMGVIKEASIRGVSLQREQKNLSFFYGVSSLPFNFVYGSDLDVSRRSLKVCM